MRVSSSFLLSFIVENVFLCLHVSIIVLSHPLHLNVGIQRRRSEENFRHC